MPEEMIMIAQLGRSLISKIQSFLYGLGYFGKTIKASIFFITRGKISRKILVMQLLFTFIEALPITSVLAIGLGTAIHLIGYSTLISLGQPDLIYSLLVLIISRELGPLLLAFVVSARSATAIATEIGGMVVSHEIEAYISVGIDPINHLVAPRFLGVTASLFFLNIYFSIFGLFAPAVVIQFFNPISFSEYFAALFKAFTIETVITSLLKSIFFGMIIGLISTLSGFNVERASTEVPQAGIQAVGKSILFFVIADIVITIASYIL